MPSKPVPRPSPKPSPRPSPKPKPVPQPASSNAFYSPFFGRNGEMWSPRARLADWSYAGYMGLQAAIPSYPVKFNVRDFGAKGNGKTDDTKAFIAALAAASEVAALFNTFDCSTRWRQRRCTSPHNGFLNQGKQGVAVFVPPGTYVITQSITITQSNVVLRGASMGNTILFFPKPLQAIYGRSQSWSFGSGFLIIDGNNAGGNQAKYQLARVTADADKGSWRLQVSSTAGIQVGQWVRIYALAPSPNRRRQLLQNGTAVPASGPGGDAVGIAVEQSGAGGGAGGLLPLTPVLQRQVAVAAEYAASELAEEGVWASARGGTLDAYLYGDNLVDSGTNAFEGADHIRFSFRVTAKGSNWIQLSRPLPYNLRTRWQVHVYQIYASVQHSGIENFTFKFPWDVYPVHLGCKGYNAIAVTSVVNAWIRNIRIINADNGIVVTQSDFVSVRSVSLVVERPRWSQSTYPDNGHHALMIGRSADVSFRFFNIGTRYMHDLSLDGFAERNVFSSGTGVDMNIDCHRAGPHNNLFGLLRLGKATRAFRSGGEETRGAHSGARANNTFWNIAPSARGAKLELPSCEFGPLLNFIGSYLPPVQSRDSRYAESVAATSAATEGNATLGGIGGSNATGATISSDGGLVGIADAYNPAWCLKKKWRITLVPPGRVLLPSNLFQAMADTRRQRGLG
ncbi:hypothetical protein CHLNCDRAFT_137072 [Chlorella variabilis]|uniref:Rhamnogalacturonase A/B/Epimerase-like pectate lyase domain-containing protein n=1 Tax=Chlorella variabilis TaxID=554065 RepID=E1ZLX8_CHLVA|nr:hypothetical protein CHLNCDRAFT_137072 [Chlorella variabilis]EFN53344.1 hypothetical protein CHLNCDRAFT_137072 [Chlorella variabilis]|eukprot:XP_005845446.1 hypothetical protein CHLNCDRAFT_137072 [Chlorella variabilis]